MDKEIQQGARSEPTKWGTAIPPQREERSGGFERTAHQSAPPVKASADVRTRSRGRPSYRVEARLGERRAVDEDAGGLLTQAEEEEQPEVS